MSCNNSCKVCRKLAFITDVAFTDGNLVLTLPDNISYDDGYQYCFVITTALPDGVTLNAPVVVVVGDGTTQFPVLCRCGNIVVSQQISTRRRYPFRVNTSAAAGSITILSTLPQVDTTTLASLNDAEAAPATPETGG